MGKYSIIWNDSVMTRKLENKTALYIPVRIDKVMIPCERDGSTSLLEKIILKILYVRSRNDEEIAEILCLPLGLIKSIYEKLVADEYIDSTTCTLTEKGRIYLLDLKVIDDKKEPMYIFYDLVAEQYWNIVLPEEEYRKLKVRESIIHEDGKCRGRKINIGTEGNENRVFLNYVPIFGDKKKEPTPEEIYEIIKGHKELLRAAKYEDIDIPTTFYTKSPRVTYDVNVFDVGEVCYLGTSLYVPQDISRYNEWQVLNPFGFGEAGFYKGVLEKKFLGKNEDKNFKKCIQNLYNSIGEDIRGHVSFDEGDSYLNEIFSLEIEEHPEVKKQLKDSFENHLKIVSGEKEGNQNQERKKASIGYLISIFNAIEAALKISIKKSGDLEGKIRNRMVGINGIKVKVGAEKLGLKISENDNLLKLNYETLKYGNSLLPLIARNILLETDGIKSIAKYDKDFIENLGQLKKLRDTVAHNSDEEVDLEFILEYNQLFLREVGSLLGIAYWNYIEYSEFVDPGKLEELKEYLAEESTIYNAELGIVRSEKLDRNIEKYLTNLRFYFKCLEKRIGNPRSVNAVLSISRIYEALLEKMKDSILDTEAKNLVTDDKEENLEVVKQVLRDYGFLSAEKTQEESDFEDKFLTVDTNRLRNTFDKFEKGVISTKSYTFLFSLANKQKNKFVVELSEKVPEFFSFGVRLDGARGHGNKDVTEEELSYLREGIEKILRALKPIALQN